MLHIVGRESQRRPQILLGQFWVRFEQISECAAGTQLAQDQLDRDARVFDTWLPIMTAGSMEMRACVMDYPLLFSVAVKAEMVAENSDCDKFVWAAALIRTFGFTQALCNHFRRGFGASRAQKPAWRDRLTARHCRDARRASGRHCSRLDRQ
jgi:hypothetical protein